MTNIVEADKAGIYTAVLRYGYHNTDIDVVSMI